MTCPTRRLTDRIRSRLDKGMEIRTNAPLPSPNSPALT